MKSDPYHFLKGQNQADHGPKLRLRQAESANYRRQTCYDAIEGEGVTALRLVVILRDGHRFSFPYSHLGLIEMPSPGELVIYPTMGNRGPVTVKGRGIGMLAHLLDLHRLHVVREAPHAGIEDDDVIVSSIRVGYPDEE
jgi:hypothetical protein